MAAGWAGRPGMVRTLPASATAKPAPQLAIGTRVRVESNDKMVSGIWQA